MDLTSKILFIQCAVDKKLRLILDTRWSSKSPIYRQDIRSCLSTQFSAHFSREQLAQLHDLNWLPIASDGYISISHCQLLGGFVFSQFKNGFDVEETARISVDILKRTSSEAERDECSNAKVPIEFLWVAKESGFKALSSAPSSTYSDLLISDLVCTEWQSHFESQVFGFRLKSTKTLAFNLNKGFIFSDGPCLFSVFFK